MDKSPFASRMDLTLQPSFLFSWKRWLSPLLLHTAMGTTALAAQHVQEPDANLEVIRAILELPDSQIDLANAKLTIDRMIDPQTDIASGRKQLDAMVAEIRARLPAHPSSRHKLEALQTCSYQAGPWNGHSTPGDTQ